MLQVVSLLFFFAGLVGALMLIIDTLVINWRAIGEALALDPGRFESGVFPKLPARNFRVKVRSVRTIAGSPAQLGRPALHAAA